MPATTLTPTAEQADAVAKFKTGASLAIEAGAGAGKTSTLRLLAEAATGRRVQYVAFNKAIVVEAGEKMPGHVVCNTAHALAFRAVGKNYAHRLNSDRMKSGEIAARLGIDPVAITVQDGTRKRLSSGYLASLVMRTVARYCASADREIGVEHVPYVNGIDVPPGRRENNARVAAEILPYARVAWADLSDRNGSLPFRHEHYLKLWQLSNPRIGADVILFDEAQDANPVMVAVVAAQAHAQLVWVGDSQQQIYSFTGAVNALASVPHEETAYLTQSFRFGPAVAEVANRILADLDAELRIEGTKAIPSVVGPVSDPDVVLTRTNAEAVRTALGAIAEGLRPHIVGGGKEIVAFARAAENLMQGRPAGHPDLACFDSWDEVRSYVEQDEQGSDLRLLVNLVDEFGVETIVSAFDRMPREENADLVISTAHKSKGREWDRVRLGGDFPEAPTGEELRLLYVAVTRARLALDVSAVDYLRRVADVDVETRTVEADETATVEVEAPVVRTLDPEAGRVLLAMLWDAQAAETADAKDAAILAAIDYLRAERIPAAAS